MLNILKQTIILSQHEHNINNDIKDFPSVDGVTLNIRTICAAHQL